MIPIHRGVPHISAVGDAGCHPLRAVGAAFVSPAFPGVPADTSSFAGCRKWGKQPKNEPMSPVGTAIGKTGILAGAQARRTDLDLSRRRPTSGDART